MTGVDKVIRWSTAGAVIGVTVVAAAASYEHAYAMVYARGETGWTARLIPLLQHLRHAWRSLSPLLRGLPAHRPATCATPLAISAPKLPRPDLRVPQCRTLCNRMYLRRR